MVLDADIRRSEYLLTSQRYDRDRGRAKMRGDRVRQAWKCWSWDVEMDVRRRDEVKSEGGADEAPEGPAVGSTGGPSGRPGALTGNLS